MGHRHRRQASRPRRAESGTGEAKPKADPLKQQRSPHDHVAEYGLYGFIELYSVATPRHSPSVGLRLYILLYRVSRVGAVSRRCVRGSWWGCAAGDATALASGGWRGSRRPRGPQSLVGVRSAEADRSRLAVARPLLSSLLSPHVRRRGTRYAGGRRASGRGAAGAPHPTHYAPQSQRGAEVGSLGRAQEPLQFLCQLLQHEEERHANRVGGRQRRRTPTTSTFGLLRLL